MLVDNYVNALTKPFLVENTQSSIKTGYEGTDLNYSPIIPNSVVVKTERQFTFMGERIPNELYLRIGHGRFDLDRFSITSSYIPGGPIVKVVTKAKRRLLELEDDWDGEGSPGFKSHTFELVAGFLYELYFEFSPIENFVTEVCILPSCEGSIDLYWSTENFELIIVFRENETFSFYGDDKFQKNVIQGKYKPSTNMVANWMKERIER